MGYPGAQSILKCGNDIEEKEISIEMDGCELILKDFHTVSNAAYGNNLP